MTHDEANWRNKQISIIRLQSVFPKVSRRGRALEPICQHGVPQAFNDASAQVDVDRPRSAREPHSQAGLARLPRLEDRTQGIEVEILW